MNEIEEMYTVSNPFYWSRTDTRYWREEYSPFYHDNTHKRSRLRIIVDIDFGPRNKHMARDLAIQELIGYINSHNILINGLNTSYANSVHK